MAVVTIRLGKKRTVAAVCRLYKGDVGIRQNSPTALRQNADEGIIGGMQNKRRHSNAIQDWSGSRSRVIVVRTLEAAVVGGDFIVEIAQG